MVLLTSVKFSVRRNLLTSSILIIRRGGGVGFQNHKGRFNPFLEDGWRRYGRERKTGPFHPYVSDTSPLPVGSRVDRPIDPFLVLYLPSSHFHYLHKDHVTRCLVVSLLPSLLFLIDKCRTVFYERTKDFRTLTDLFVILSTHFPIGVTWRGLWKGVGPKIQRFICRLLST